MELGRGAMGVTYKATIVKSSYAVALRSSTPGFIGDE